MDYNNLIPADDLDIPDIPLAIRNKGISIVDYLTALIVASAPETLNTLQKIATAINNDPEFATTIASALSQKVAASDVVTIAEANKLLVLDDDAELPANIKGNATTAGKLAATKTISLIGAITGSVSTDLSGNVEINTTDGTAGATYDSAHSFGTTGYQKLSNGLLLQWGRATSNATITYPIAFAQGTIPIVIPAGLDVGHNGYEGANSITNTGFFLFAGHYNGNTDTRLCQYFAIGQA